MAESEQDILFKMKVIPIMSKVREDLQNKQSQELREHSSSFAGIMSGAVGPDGGMAAMQAFNDTLRYTGEWNSKTTEDYIEMVKSELHRQQIAVDADMEKKMIDKMIEDKIPRSSIEYIMRKAITNTIFYIPQEVAKSPLEQQMDAEVEKRYNPSSWEKNAGIVIGSSLDLACMGGFGGGWKTAATWVGTDMLLTNLGEEEQVNRSDIPIMVLPGHEEEYRRIQQENQEATEVTSQDKPQSVNKEQVMESQTAETAQKPQEQFSPSNQTNMNGWQGLLTSFGLNGISDIGHNLGYVIAMLPDMLVGLFTGKTKSINMKNEMMPIASIVAGLFVKNPILKMVLIGMGGLNLLNKAGHEAIDGYKAKEHPEIGNGRVNYRVYLEESLNSRIVDPDIKGNCLIATIDRVPCTIALPDRVVDAYNRGALPLNTLANAVLAKNDQMRQMVSENYESNARQEISRPLTQR